MDPAMITALIFLGLRLLEQAVAGSQRAKEKLSDFEAYLVALGEENREPTVAELAQFTISAQAADDNLASAIQRLKDAAAERV